MKKILIVIHDMRIGGAQKSLLSFLQALASDGRGKAYEVHVLPLNPTGEFLAQIPEGIHVDEPSAALRWMGTHMNGKLLLEYFSLRGLLGEMLWVCCRRLGLLKKKGNLNQQLWSVWRSFVPRRKEAYDAAIAYMDGVPAYYVMDKVSAKKKVLWLHNDYRKQAYDPSFDEKYYSACDAAVTVSAECRDALCRAFPQYADRIHVLENISSHQSVLAKSREGSCPEYDGTDGLRLLTVGRLHEQKGIDLAVDAARYLKEEGVRFRWLVVGEGSERAQLEERIRAYGLSSCFQLIGSRENPYIYMRKCDILVQTSRYEGKSIVLDEAKMLDKPIVVTDYSTVADAVVHGETGFITEMNGEAIGRGIMRMAQDEAMRCRITENLKRLPKGNEEELKRYLDVMF